MKKAFIVLSLAVMMFAGTMIQTQKAHAITPQVAMGAASGAGYAAVGAYVVGAMLLAGGAAVILDDPDAADQIRQHGQRVWNGFDQATKDAWAASIEATIAAGSATLTLTDTMTNSLTSALSLVGNSANVVVSDKYMRSLGVAPQATWSTTSFSASISYTTGFHFVYGGVTSGTIIVGQSWTDPDARYQIQMGGYNPVEYPYTNFDKWALYKRTSVVDYQSFIKVWLSLGIVGALPVVTAVDTPVPNQDYFNDAVDNALNRLKGIKEVSFDPKKWIPLGAGGALLVGGSAGEPLLEDGTPYTGDITWKHPELTLDDISNPTYDAPSVPIDNVNVGDQPFINDTTANPPATGDTTAPTTTDGILTGLWDWLKGILQSILDAIKAIPGAITGFLQGIIDAINAVLTFLGTMAAAIADAIAAIFIPPTGYFQEYWNVIKAKWDTKLPIIGQIYAFLAAVQDVVTSPQVPEFKINLGDLYGGGTHKWLDVSFFTDYKTLIVNFIRFVAWFIFLKRLYARIPRIIGE